MTTCPSGVHYMHLVDHARAHIEKTYRRPLARPADARALLAASCRRARCSAWRSCAARLGKPLAPALAQLPARRRAARGHAGARARAAAAARRDRRPGRIRRGRRGRRRRAPRRPADAAARRRCWRRAINAATIRLLNRAGVEVVLPKGEGCCGALVHHMGREERALAHSRAATSMPGRARSRAAGSTPSSITASGCGTTIKDYGFMLRDDPAYAEKAARVSALAKDITRISRRRSNCRFGRTNRARRRLSLGLLDAARPEDQRRAEEPAARAGFVVKDVPEGHICCGSAGTYNILQPEIARPVCAPARSPISPASSPTSSRRAISAASRRSGRARLSPSSIPSSFSTGPAAGRRRRGAPQRRV